ncbi:zinc finger BED domain-containing protein DAYSLEEPER-like protein [Tanacetum coccineum]
MTLDSEALNELHNITHRLRKTESIFKSHLLTQVNNDEEFATFSVNMTCDEYVEVAEILRCLPLPQMDTSPTESYAPIKIEMQPECPYEIAQMVILHGYPVEHKEFMAFLHNLQPKFNLVICQDDCVATYLSESIVQEALQVCEETVKKVRNCVKYVKTSEPIEDYFLGLKQQLQVLNTRNLSLDDQTKWNTTYEMLLAASELKDVFSCLETLKPDYFKSPSGEEWKVVDNLCTYLKLIFDTASLLASSSVAPANTFFDKIWMLHVELTSIAVVMDPRYKMKFVDFMFAKIFGDEATSFINIVDEGINGLFLEYATDDVPGHSSNGVELTEFDAFIIKSRSQQLKLELDQYLEESLNVESK